MLFMVIEKFRDADAVYRRFAKRGRMLPDGLRYVDSWIEAEAGRGFQLMETQQPELFRVWTENWSDLVDFEIVPVITSAEAAARRTTSDD
jgi:hypothetical protein